MKAITENQLSNAVEAMLKERENMAKVTGKPFVGLSEQEICSELRKRIGDDWMLRKAQPTKFTKEDINAVANSRFYRKTGLKLLMGFGIIIMGLALITRTWSVLPVYVYYGLNMGVAVIFVYVYGKKQRETRQELWRGIDGEEEK